MQSSKPFTRNNCKLFVKLFSLIISCSLLICCVREITKPVLPSENQIAISESAINVNNASLKELEKLPRVGEKIARRIIEHREKFGSFRRAEHLLLIDGISDANFREMKNFVRVE